MSTADSPHPVHAPSLQQPQYRIDATRVRILPSVFAGLAGSFCFILAYYATLALLPAAFASGMSPGSPVRVWTRRLDISQYMGTIIHPPWPDLSTWIIGLTVLFGALVSAAIAYAVVLSWATSRPSFRSGLLAGGALFVGLRSFLSLGSGFQPAVMRNALPDAGFFEMGWTGWATLQLLVCSLLWGVVTSSVYRLLFGRR